MAELIEKNQLESELNKHIQNKVKRTKVDGAFKQKFKT